jgi:hypothetical protein
VHLDAVSPHRYKAHGAVRSLKPGGTRHRAISSGERHVRRILAESVVHYHRDRTKQRQGKESIVLEATITTALFGGLSGWAAHLNYYNLTCDRKRGAESARAELSDLTGATFGGRDKSMTILSGDREKLNRTPS